MSYFSDFLQDILDLSPEEKIKMIIDSMIEMGPTFKKLDSKGDGNIIIYTLLGTSIAVDGKLTQGEYDFLHAFFKSFDIKMSDEEIIKLIKATSSKDAYLFIKDIKKYLDNEGIINIVKIVSALCSIDNKINKEEAEYISSLLFD